MKSRNLTDAAVHLGQISFLFKSGAKRKASGETQFPLFGNEKKKESLNSYWNETWLFGYQCLQDSLEKRCKISTNAALHSFSNRLR